MTSVFEIPVHPAADVFPMLDDDELAELANDISENGLQHPIVVSGVNGHRVLVDGRNRRAACKLVGIEPHVMEFEGDPISYVISANVRRRHLSKGQLSMAVAKICFETKQNVRQSAKAANLSASRVAFGLTVLQHAPDLADQVLAGSLGLDDAYKQAQLAKAASESREAVFTELKAARPDLAEQVIEGRLTLEEAVAAQREKEKNDRLNRQGTFQNLKGIRLAAENLKSEANRARVDRLLRDYPEEFREVAGFTVDDFYRFVSMIREQVS